MWNSGTKPIYFTRYNRIHRKRCYWLYCVSTEIQHRKLDQTIPIDCERDILDCCWVIYLLVNPKIYLQTHTESQRCTFFTVIYHIREKWIHLHFLIFFLIFSLIITLFYGRLRTVFQFVKCFIIHKFFKVSINKKILSLYFYHQSSMLIVLDQDMLGMFQIFKMDLI